MWPPPIAGDSQLIAMGRKLLMYVIASPSGKVGGEKRLDPESAGEVITIY